MKYFLKSLFFICTAFLFFSSVPKTVATTNTEIIKDLGPLRRDSSYFHYPLFKNLDLIYSENLKNSAPLLGDYARQIDFKLSQIFKTNPYFRRNSIILSSPRIQIPNAFASLYPIPLNYPLPLHYPVPFIYMYSFGSIDAMDQDSIFYWYQDVLIHELTHMYQISQNTKWDKKFWWILGYLSYRNVVLSTWILEGSAVLNESIYGSGGRLFSGIDRAFVFSQLKNDFSLKRLFRGYDDSFSLREKYLHGGYFFAYLQSQYGIDKVNQFFYESSRFLPYDFYGLSFSLKRHFGKDLKKLFKEYKDHYTPLAKNQKSSKGEVLAKSKIYAPMNSDQHSIYFLISDEKSPPQLVLFDKKTKTIKKTSKNIPLGKVFFIDGEFFSSGLGRTSSTSVEHGLFKENFKNLKKYKSHSVMDFYKNNFISLSAVKGFLQNSLMLNGDFYDNTHSSAVMDHKGRVYYFKQEGEKRTLYRDKKALVSFKSYYSYPVEADKEGLYFIGATKYGSSLFVYKERRGIFRLSPSDTISFARKVKGNEFLISELGPTHYQYKLISAKTAFKQPVSYNYAFKKENIFKSPLKNSLKSSLKDSLESKTSSKPYSAFSNLALENVAFLASTDYYFMSYFQFIDPMRFNELSLNYFSSFNRNLFKLSYQYKKYRPSLAFSFSYKDAYLDGLRERYRIKTFKDLGFLEIKDVFYKLPDSNLFGRKNIWQRSKSFDVTLKYPLLRRNDWSLSWSNNFQFGQAQFNNENKIIPVLLYESKPWKSYVAYTGDLQYKYGRKYSQAYSFHKKRNVYLSYNLTHLNFAPKNYSIYLDGVLGVYLMEEIKKEWFLSLNTVFKSNIWNKEPKDLLSRPGDEFLSYSTFRQSVQNFYRVDFQVLKVLNHSHYFLTLPFGLRRWAPFAGFSFLSVQPGAKAWRNFFIPFAGLEWDINVFHDKSNAKIGLSGEYVADFSPNFHLKFWLETDFSGL